MRIGIVGLGWAATAFHAPALERVPGAVVVGGCDTSGERRAAWEKATSAPAFETLDELVARAAPDVVVVATPPDSHAGLCVEALERGLHVLCEKPFATDVQDADRVLAAAAAAGRQVAVNHEFREKPIFRAVKQGIDSGEYGRLVFCQIWQLMDLAPWDEPVAWRRAMPNRTLLEGGVHLVDLMLHYFGEPPEAVYARHSSGLQDEHTADAIHLITLEFSEGRLGQVTIDRLCAAATRYAEVRADCEHASLRASEGGRALVRFGMKRAERSGVRVEVGAGGLAWAERGTGRKVLARAPRAVGMAATAELWKQLLPAFEANVEPPSSGREARAGLAVIEAAYRSARTGARIEIEPAATLPV